MADFVDSSSNFGTMNFGLGPSSGAGGFDFRPRFSAGVELDMDPGKIAHEQEMALQQMAMVEGGFGLAASNFGLGGGNNNTGW